MAPLNDNDDARFLAQRIEGIREAIHSLEWIRADHALALFEACGGDATKLARTKGTIHQRTLAVCGVDVPAFVLLCRDEMGLSHRTIAAWARRAAESTPGTRANEYGYRYRKGHV